MKRGREKVSELDYCCNELLKEIEWWKATEENGCNDPFWPDGSNMNLIRNHILHYKGEIKRICDETGKSYPDCYYIPTPPEVDNKYMANLEQKERVKRLEMFDGKLTTKKIFYNENEMSFLLED